MTTSTVKINGSPLIEPSSYKVDTETVVDGARNIKGVFIGSVIRDSLTKLELNWKYLTHEEWKNILKLFDISKGGSFVNNVEFFSQTSGVWENKQMYVSPRTTGGATMKEDGTGKIKGWIDCRIALIEV